MLVIVIIFNIVNLIIVLYCIHIWSKLDLEQMDTKMDASCYITADSN